MAQQRPARSLVGQRDLDGQIHAQPSAPEPFQQMPVQLNVVIAAPTEGGPYPVALMLHGTHPGCPVDANGVDSWPCDPDDEQANFAGFTWLVADLAVLRGA